MQTGLTNAALAETLVLGIGNILLTDDGVGVHVTTALAAQEDPGRGLTIIDGGTVGLALLNELRPDMGFIAVDAMELGAASGTVMVFQGKDMDRHLSGRKTTAHEVALSDMMVAAQLSGCHPRQRALVAVQPAVTTWGLAPTPAVQAAIPKAVEAVLSIVKGWRHAG